MTSEHERLVAKLKRCVEEMTPEEFMEGIGQAWQPIATAPVDGTIIKAAIERHLGSHYISMASGFFDSDGNECKAWVYVDGDGCPRCWTDGVCWKINENGVSSAQPEFWKSLDNASASG